MECQNYDAHTIISGILHEIERKKKKERKKERQTRETMKK